MATEHTGSGPLTADERRDWTRLCEALGAELRTWTDPTEFRERADAALKQFTSRVLFRLSATKPLREAFSLGRLAEKTSASAVRLSDGNWPDGHLRRGSDVINIEVTEILERGRRRSDEYAKERPAWEHDPVENWVLRADQIPSLLVSAVERKNAKRYSAASELLVYLNLGTYGLRQREIEGAIVAAHVEHRGRFDAVHVLWNDRVYLGTRPAASPSS